MRTTATVDDNYHSSHSVLFALFRGQRLVNLSRDLTIVSISIVTCTQANTASTWLLAVKEGDDKVNE